MEDRIISEIRKSHVVPAAEGANNSFTLQMNDQELEECLSILSSDFDPAITSSYNNNSASSSNFQSPPPAPYYTPSSQRVLVTPPPYHTWDLNQPTTPLQQKIKKLTSAPKYQDSSKAGELAVRIAVILFGEDVMRRSGLGDNQGKLCALDENKMKEIENIVTRVYITKADVASIWNKCRIAIAKKCQRLRHI